MSHNVLQRVVLQHEFSNAIALYRLTPAKLLSAGVAVVMFYTTSTCNHVVF